jgi:hypothetical protein
VLVTPLFTVLMVIALPPFRPAQQGLSGASRTRPARLRGGIIWPMPRAARRVPMSAWTPEIARERERENRNFPSFPRWRAVGARQRAAAARGRPQLDFRQNRDASAIHAREFGGKRDRFGRKCTASTTEAAPAPLAICSAGHVNERESGESRRIATAALFAASFGLSSASYDLIRPTGSRIRAKAPSSPFRPGLYGTLLATPATCHCEPRSATVGW